MIIVITVIIIFYLLTLIYHSSVNRFVVIISMKCSIYIYINKYDKNFMYDLLYILLSCQMNY